MQLLQACALVALCLTAVFPLSAQTDGSLDTSFNAAAPPGTLVLALLQQPDGRILTGGTFTSINGVPRRGLARLHPDGSLDASFDPGTVGNDFVTSIARQVDGKILATGTGLQFGSGTTGLVRLLADGSIDPSFRADTAGGAAYRVVLDPAGRIYLAGDFSTVNGLVRRNVARLLPDGTVDTTFNPGSGASEQPFAVFGLTLQGDGKLLVVGAFSSFGGAPRGHLARLLPDGSLDASFALGPGADGMVNAIVPLPTGKLLLVGDFARFDGVLRQSVARLLPDGSLDPTFDARVSAGAFVNAAFCQADGACVIAGQFTTVGGTSRNGLARLTPDGSLDQSFTPGSGLAGRAAYALAPGTDGRLMLAGNFASYNGTPRGALARVFHLASIPSLLINLSTRATVGTGDRVLIGGFVVQGAGARRVLLRVLGPSLGAFGVTRPLADPSLTLFDAAGRALASNDSWQQSQAAEISATGLAPGDQRECALLVSLPSGAYTAVVRGAGAETGVAIVEIYDLDYPAGGGASAAHLANLSTRARVESGENVAIGGLAVRGTLPRRVLLRALGPSLAAFGVTEPLRDPELTVVDEAGRTIAANDNWATTQAAAIAATGLSPSQASESAILLELPAGNYTALVRSHDGTPGIALIEAYELP
ncbi:MAG: delta-60 repeat domain-containing protein [Verrucomicrobia bacterium]|nr:delta-60 repeat domain-containing protein [Verrucomicrobiota bacterium]